MAQRGHLGQDAGGSPQRLLAVGVTCQNCRGEGFFFFGSRVAA